MTTSVKNVGIEQLEIFFSRQRGRQAIDGLNGTMQRAIVSKLPDVVVVCLGEFSSSLAPQLATNLHAREWTTVRHSVRARSGRCPRTIIANRPPIPSPSYITLSRPSPRRRLFAKALLVSDITATLTRVLTRPYHTGDIVTDQMIISLALAVLQLRDTLDRQSVVVKSKTHNSS